MKDDKTILIVNLGIIIFVSLFVLFNILQALGFYIIELLIVGFVIAFSDLLYLLWKISEKEGV